MGSISSKARNGNGGTFNSTTFQEVASTMQLLIMKLASTMLLNLLTMARSFLRQFNILKSEDFEL